MRNTVAWRYELLDTQTRQFFRVLSVFRGGFSLPAAERLGAETGLEGAVAVADALTSLVEHSLVQPVPNSAGQPRYAMFETVRELGWEQLCAHGEQGRLEEAHASIALAGALAAAPNCTALTRGSGWIHWKRTSPSCGQHLPGQYNTIRALPFG